MDMIDIKSKLWDYYWENDREFLEGYIRCLWDNKLILDGDYCDLCKFIDSLYE